MTPDREFVAAFLRKVEQGIHRAGWDQPALLALLEWLPARGVLRIDPVPLPGGNPGDFLEFSAALLSRGDPTAELLMAGIAIPSFFGLMLITEAWGNDDLTPEQGRARTKPLADTVGSYESRELCAVDIRGNIYGLHRRRGEKPIDWPSEHFTGRVPMSLHAITLAIAKKMPPGLADLDALRRAGEAIPSSVEIAAVWEASQAQS